MIYSVIVDVSANEVDKVFHYKGEGYQVGSRVLVNFANRVIEGFIVDEQETADCPPEKLKEIIKPLDEFPAVSKEMLQLGVFLRKEYNLRWADALRLFIPAEMRGNRVKSLSKKAAQLAVQEDLQETLNKLKPNAAKQRELVGYLFREGATLCEKLNSQFGSSALNALKEKGIVEIFEMTVRRTPYRQLEIATQNARTLT
ncbi:MAG: hypothetical protein ACI4QH_02085, partial [Candidatus Fimimonas sp.]